MASPPHLMGVRSFQPTLHGLATSSNGGQIIPDTSARSRHLTSKKKRCHHSSFLCATSLTQHNDIIPVTCSQLFHLIPRRPCHSSHLCMDSPPHFKKATSFQSLLHGLATSSQQGHIIPITFAKTHHLKAATSFQPTQQSLASSPQLK
jgi:hypothetical protein